jgi:iron(III) transport system substrate-binding protein
MRGEFGMRFKFPLPLLSILWLGLLSSGIIAYVPNDNYPDLKGEKVVVYILFQEEEGCRLLDYFKEKTALNYSYLRMPSGEAVARVIKEAAAPMADILLGGPADAHQQLANQGLLEKYISPVAKGIEPGFKSGEGYWTGIYMGPVAICINENRWRREFAVRGLKKPETFQDLLNPAYQGEIIMPDPVTSGTAYTILASLIQLWGETTAVAYFRKLHNAVAEYTKSGFTVAQKVAAGEYLLGINFIHDQLLMKKAGFNISHVIPPMAGWEIGCVSLVKNRPYSKAARAFIDFMVGREAGQLHTNLTERISTRKDVTLPKGATPLAEISINPRYDFFKAAQMKEEYLRLWREQVITTPNQ